MRTCQKLRIYLLNLYDFIFFYVLMNLFPRRDPGAVNVIFLCSGGLGDLFISSILFKYSHKLKINGLFIIRQQYKSVAESLFKGVQFIYLDKSKFRFNLFYKIEFIQSIRKCNPGVFISINRGRSFLDDQIALFSGARNIWALGPTPNGFIKLFKEKMDKYYDQLLFPDIESEYLKQNKLLELLGISTTLPFCTTNLINHISINRQKRIIISPFASSPIKEWSIENYQAIIKWFSENVNCEIFILGIASTEMKSLKYHNVYNKINSQSLEEDIALIQNCDLFIGNDSGLAHVAKYFNIPRIIIVGGGCFGAYFPYGSEEYEDLLYKPLTCFLCEWDCKYRDPFCISRVTVGEVISRIQKYI